MICHETYKSASGKWLYPDKVYFKNSICYELTNNQVVHVGAPEKMSKSKNNTVQPQSIIAAYGVDATRIFVISDSPAHKDLEWNEKSLQGVWKLLNRIWRIVIIGQQQIIEKQNIASQLQSYDNQKDQKIILEMHKVIRDITDSLDKINLNLYIAHLRVFINELSIIETNACINEKTLQQAFEVLAILLNPVAPHLAAEIWQIIGKSEELNFAKWPIYNEAILIDKQITYALQINGKLRAQLIVNNDIPLEEIKQIAQEQPKIQKHLLEKSIIKIIVIPNKVINIVCK